MSRSAFVYGLLGAAVVSLALSPILVRLAGSVPGVAIAVWRTGIAASLLVPVALRKASQEMRQFSWRDIGLITASGVLLGLHFIAWIESLFYTSVASASVLVTTSPVFLVILGYVFLGEHLSRRTVIGIMVAVLGAVLISWGDATDVEQAAPAPLLGNSIALAASLLVSFYLLIGRVVRRKTSWLAYVFPLYGVAAGTTLLVALLRGVPLFGYDMAFYVLCAFMALGPQIIGHGSFNYALAFFPAALVSMLALLEPVGASILAYFLFGEVPRWLAVVGMAVVLGAVAIVTWSGRGERRVEEPKA